MLRGFVLIAAACLFLNVSQPVAAAEKVALVIGNAGYTQLNPLNNTTADARAMAASLREMGFAAELVLDADEAALRRAVRQFTAASAAKDIAVVFYAGHAVQVDGSNFILPVDFEPPRAQSDIKISGLNVDDLLGAIHSRVRVVFLDACRDNPGVARRLSNATRSAGSEGLAPVKAADVDGDGGIFIAYATASGKVAQDGDGMHSPFTQALLDNIKAPVSIDDMFSLVTKQVSVSTKNAQRPYKYASLGSIVCLAEGCGNASTASAGFQSVPSNSGATVLGAIDPDDERWLFFGMSTADGARYYLERDSIARKGDVVTLSTQTTPADGVGGSSNSLVFDCKKNAANVYAGAALQNGRKVAGSEFYSAPEIVDLAPIKRGTLYESLADFACNGKATTPELAKNVVFSDAWAQVAIDDLAIKWSILPSSIKKEGNDAVFFMKHDMPLAVAQTLPLAKVRGINEAFTSVYTVKVVKAKVTCDTATLSGLVTEGWSKSGMMTGKFFTDAGLVPPTKLENGKVGANVGKYVCSKIGKPLVMQ